MRLPVGRWTVLSTFAALVVGVGATAGACANLATLNLSATSGKAGATITLTGASFAVPRASTGLAPTPVVIRWQSDAGPVLAEAVPDRFGAISATLAIPDAKPGKYVILAFQQTPRRTPGAPPEQPPTLFAELGTPARTSFEILVPGAVTVRPTALTETAGDGGELDSTVWIVLTAAFGAVAMSLFGGGLIAFVDQSRKSRLPAEARWVPPGWYR